MLYDNPYCSNSYYWHNLELIGALLVFTSLTIFICYSLIKIISNNNKKKKFELVPTLTFGSIYLAGFLLLFNKDIDIIYGVSLVCLGSVLMAIYRKNPSYILLTSGICFTLKNSVTVIFAWLNIFFLIGLLTYKLKEIKAKKRTYIFLGILLLLFIIGIIMVSYVGLNRPEGYCWSAK